MVTEREYTNGRLRLRPEQAEYLNGLLHKTWVETSRLRAEVKERLDDPGEGGLVTLMNRELRIISTIQDELRRTMEDMGLE